MKKIFFISCLFLLTLFLPVLVSAVGNISVTSTPAGATVYVDNVNKGITAIVVENIISGSHTVVIQKTGFQNYTTTVTVNNNQTTNVSASLALLPTTPTISTVTPSYGFNTGIVDTDLSGTGFSSGAIVLLTKAGQTNISATSISATSTKINCIIDLNGKTAGLWNVVVKNPDGQSATKSDGFEIKNPSAAITLSSITPNYGINNTIVTITNLAGTGFLSGATMTLRKTGYNDIPGTVTSVISSSKITGTFNLKGRTPGTYEVCVENSETNKFCGLVFTVYSSATPINGSIYIDSNPSVASAYVNSDYKGKTPLSVYNVTPGTYMILVEKSGYQDWSDRITVTAGNRTDVYSRLNEAEPGITIVTTLRTTTVTSTMTKKSTVKVPTPWPSASLTPESPVNVLAIIGVVGFGIIVFRRY